MTSCGPGSRRTRRHAKRTHATNGAVDDGNEQKVRRRVSHDDKLRGHARATRQSATSRPRAGRIVDDDRPACLVACASLTSEGHRPGLDSRDSDLRKAFGGVPSIARTAGNWNRVHSGDHGPRESSPASTPGPPPSDGQQLAAHPEQMTPRGGAADQASTTNKVTTDANCPCGRCNPHQKSGRGTAGRTAQRQGEPHEPTHYRTPSRGLATRSPAQTHPENKSHTPPGPPHPGLRRLAHGRVRVGLLECCKRGIGFHKRLLGTDKARSGTLPDQLAHGVQRLPGR